MNTNELIDILLILRTPRIGAVRYNTLVSRFGSPAAVVAALNPDVSVRDAVLREIDAANHIGARFVCDTDAEYPSALRAVKNHPPVITVCGNIDALRRPMVGIVGTRHASATGIRFISDMAREFAAHGTVVASGMAIGTDTAAHMGALSSGADLATVAVLAGGVDYIWPVENTSLYHQIIERGAIISEMPIGYTPVANNFIQRNRWIAGISDKLILGEADLNSGSMATARFAREYGRPVFAVPSHPSDSRSAGPNFLIKSGMATLCDGVSDFFEAPHEKKSEKNEPANDSILDRLGPIPISESVLAQIVKKSVVEIKRELVVLELQGLVQKQDGGYIRM